MLPSSAKKGLQQQQQHQQSDIWACNLIDFKSYVKL